MSEPDAKVPIIKCAMCDGEFEPTCPPGALVFSPPRSGNVATKHHVCTRCWPCLIAFINKKLYIDDYYDRQQEQAKANLPKCVRDQV
jgi:Fe-S-cluster-containing hydrogenase component 2